MKQSFDIVSRRHLSALVGIAIGQGKIKGDNQPMIAPSRLQAELEARSEPPAGRALTFLMSQPPRLGSIVLSQPHLFGPQSGLGSVANAQFPQDVRHVILHGSFSQKQCVSDFSIAGAG